MNIAHNHLPLITQLVEQTTTLIHQEYPNGIRLSLSAPPDKIITPKGIYPTFYGCYDWHSAVHSHWQIILACRLFPDARFVADGLQAISQTITADNITTEMEWVNERPNFEMPYGMAWLLTLCAELAEWDTPQAKIWRGALRPLEEHAIARFKIYCSKMAKPMRGGLHNQSAFSLALVWDYAQSQQERELADWVNATATRFYGADTAVDLYYEPSAADFLSPALSEADLMGRVLSQEGFVTWLGRFAPQGFSSLTPVTVVDPSNGQLAHWAGLNFSRNWMLNSIAEALPADHPHVTALQNNAHAHLEAAIPTAAHPDYMISHWVPTFALYALTSSH